jgi:hypothetical protein
MARILTKSNRPIVIQEPQSGLDTFLTEIAKYASPEYQQQRKLNERADARFELEKQQVSDARQRYINQQAEKNQERILEQKRYNEAKRIQDGERKYVSTNRLKKEIDEELNSLPISSFQEDGSVNTFNSIIKSIIPSESNDEFGIGDVGIEYSQNKYNKRKMLSDNAYAQADIYKPNFPELTRDQLAKSIVSGDVVDLISNKIDKQGSLTDIEKDKLKGFNSSIKENLEIISKAQETLYELDPEKDEALFNSISSSINTYRNDINALNKQIDSIYSNANQKKFSIVDDSADFSGANLNLDDEDSSTVPMYLMDNESFAQLEDEESIFESEEQENQRLNSNITNLLAIEDESQNNDTVYSDRLDESAPPATEEGVLDLVESREDGEKLNVPRNILDSLLPPGLKANQEEEKISPDGRERVGFKKKEVTPFNKQIPTSRRMRNPNIGSKDLRKKIKDIKRDLRFVSDDPKKRAPNAQTRKNIQEKLPSKINSLKELFLNIYDENTGGFYNPSNPNYGAYEDRLSADELEFLKGL